MLTLHWMSWRNNFAVEFLSVVCQSYLALADVFQVNVVALAGLGDPGGRLRPVGGRVDVRGGQPVPEGEIHHADAIVLDVVVLVQQDGFLLSLDTLELLAKSLLSEDLGEFKVS